MAFTAWIAPSSVATSFGVTNPTNALAVDGANATATYPTANDVRVYFVRYTSTSGSGFSSAIQQSLAATGGVPLSAENSTGFPSLTMAEILDGRFGSAILAYFGDPGNPRRIYLRGYDFSSVPLNSILVKVYARTTYTTTDTSLALDCVELRIEYEPGPQSVSVPSIASTTAMGTPISTADPVNTTAQGIASTSAFGQAVLSLNGTASGFAGSVAIGTPVAVQLPPPAAPSADWSALGKETEKQYLYRVYKPDGTFVGVWRDVQDEFQYTQAINTPGTTTTVQLSRSAQTRKEVRARLVTVAAEPRITDDSNGRVVTYETTNNVGDGTDVVENYNVDVYVYYGDNGYRITHAGEVRITEGGERLLTSTGAPMGKRIFTGFILDYEAEYGPDANDGVTVTLSSHGWELSNEEVLDGTNTNVTMSTTSPEQVVKNLLDTNPGKMTWAAGTLDTTGVTDTFKFQLNNKLEAIKSAFNRTPDDYYWFGDVAENYVYMKQASTTADHTFILGKHIKSLKMKKSIESLVNRIYFVGGEVTPGTPSSVLFKKYEDAPSLAALRKGLERITDRRYTVATSAQKRANKTLSRYKDPIFSSPLVISAAVYDIESIRLGQTVQFRGFNNYIDELPPLLIVNYGYHPHRATLQIGELQEHQYDALADTESALANEQYESLPNAPS